RPGMRLRPISKLSRLSASRSTVAAPGGTEATSSRKAAGGGTFLSKRPYRHIIYSSVPAGIANGRTAHFGDRFPVRGTGKFALPAQGGGRALCGDDRSRARRLQSCARNE